MGLVLSVGAQRAKAAMLEISKGLDAYSFHPQRGAYVSSQDGSVFIISDAFLKEWVDPDGELWVFLFAEHYEPMCFDADALNHWATLKDADEEESSSVAAPASKDPQSK